MDSETYHCDGCGEHDSMGYLAPELNENGHEEYTCIFCSMRAYTAAELGIEDEQE